ncbi:uncharacterized protein LOC136021185 [Lathamus discolor]|uniref:uncharacterized protein LOC136021185 n=1 Tax=Lathamus discolor TaxID=678569 RepID=UPI0032B7F721
MEASTWQHCGCLRDDTRQERGRDRAASRAASAGTREGCILQEGPGHRDLPGPRSEAQAEMSRREQWELCLDHPVSGGRWGGEEGEAPPKVYELEVGHRHMGRTVKPVVYRLEESEYRRLVEEAEAEAEEEWEAMEHWGPVMQEGYPGDGSVASPSLSRLHASQLALRRERSRSDSESSAESRQVNQVALNCPSGGHKPSVPIRSDSFERNALLMDYILQSKQEATASPPCVPRESSKAAESFRQAMSFALHPGGAPDLFQNGEADPARQQVQRGPEGMLAAAAGCAPAAVGSPRPPRQSSAPLPEQRAGEAAAAVPGARSPRKPPPAPPARSHSRDSLALSMSRALAMTEALLEPRGAALGPEPAQGQGAAGGPEQPQAGRRRQEEDENVLKVADAKKAFEKPKEKAPAPGVARKAPLVQLAQGKKQNKMAKGFKTG